MRLLSKQPKSTPLLLTIGRRLSTIMLSSLVVSGPSGSGKSTLLQKLFQYFPNQFSFTVSHTTRQPRHNEVDGRDYHFVTHQQFQDMMVRDEFIESAHFANNYYGTSFKALTATGDRIPVLDVDLQGVKSLKAKQIPAKYLLILPVSIETLRRQLKKRNTDNEAAIEERLKHAEYDLRLLQDEKSLFDETIVNDDLDEAFDKMITFVKRHFNVQSASS